jgi:hypothetical protein
VINLECVSAFVSNRDHVTSGGVSQEICLLLFVCIHAVPLKEKIWVLWHSYYSRNYVRDIYGGTNEL